MNYPTIGKGTDLTGMRFGELTVLRKADPVRGNVRGKCWVCQCDRGEVVTIPGNDLYRGYKRNCGTHYSCRYDAGAGVKCRNQECASCGWNPKVAKARTQEIMRAMEEM